MVGSDLVERIVMVDFIYDDGGRKAAGFKGEARDCVTRATAILTGRNYREVYKMMARAEQKVTGKRSARNGISKKASPKVFAELGIVKVKLPKGAKPTYSEAHILYGDCIVSSTRHLAAVTKGYLRDTFDGRTYEWPNEYGDIEVRERKAMSVWVMADA